MTDTNIVLEADEPPKNGEWLDTCDILSNPTEEEMRAGLIMGLGIDPEDDASGSLIRSFTASDRDTALQKARDLKTVMLAHGVPEVSIELAPGRPNSFGVFDALFVVDEMSHHTVSRLGGNLTPCLSLVKVGRSDLPGPLCNGYGGWDLCYRIITFGYANHPGEGGPMTIPALTAGTFTIPKDSARRYAWGTEWEGGLNEGDWDKTLTNPRTRATMNFREFMGRSNAALREYHKIAHHSEHSTWAPTRKIDRLHYTSQSGTAELLRYTKEDNMPDKTEFQDWVRKTPITTGVGKNDVQKARPLEKVLSDLESTQEAIVATLNEIGKAVGRIEKNQTEGA